MTTSFNPQRLSAVIAAVLAPALLAGCSWLGGKRDPAFNGTLDQGVEASRLAGRKSLEAIVCARRFAEAQWQTATPSEVGDASLSACAPEVAEYADAITAFNLAKVGLLNVRSDDAAAQRLTATRWANEDVERKRTEVRTAAVRRALELRRDQ